MTTLHDLIGIPTEVHKSDFVMALNDGCRPHRPPSPPTW